MKKTLLIIFTFFYCVYGFSQDFPYSKILKMSEQEFKDGKFKYNSDKNQWILTKSNGLQATANVLSALNGHAADIKPDKNDYIVIIQNGENNNISTVSVIFYDDEIYHNIVTFAKDNASNLLETNSGKLTKCQFDYGEYAFLLQTERVGASSTTTATSAFIKTIDESYNKFNFTIYTNVEPHSAYLTREAKKQLKRDERGSKKRNASDLM